MPEIKNKGGRPKDIRLGKAITALRCSGFSAEETAGLLKIDKRNQERTFKRDFKFYFPLVWDSMVRVHNVALENNFINK